MSSSSSPFGNIWVWETHKFPISPTQRFSLRVHSSELASSLSLPFSSSTPPSSTRIIRQQFNRIQTVPKSSASSNYGFEPETVNLLPSESGLLQNATWIGLATISSKILGLVREIIVASVFGIGPVATAFKYASVLPGFSASLLGGVNGPIHITMAASLSKLSKERQRKLFQYTNAVLLLVGGLVGAVVLVTAEFIIHIYASGLWVMADGQMTREIACAQLKLMIPCMVLAGPVGLGFGYMSAEGNNILPSISPAFSSMLIIASCLVYAFMRQISAFQTADQLFGGILISCGASLGIFLQWLIQVWSSVLMQLYYASSVCPYSSGTSTLNIPPSSSHRKEREELQRQMLQVQGMLWQLMHGGGHNSSIAPPPKIG